MEAYQGERLTRAGQRFREFFEELGGAFVERETVLVQIALALLSREHVLMTGPPGTAKSKLASAALGRITDETTGQASLFSRQFTESTVQTDLVGPIDFKTLVESGRTQHFTDEGMLGAVHAFLDEVFDGRDMLLRSTLNLLNERELKQGTKVTRGHIECALMTSNRYLSEVLEGSRETLLAFVDRVAFLSFVPKGFASADSLTRVLRTELGGRRPRALSAPLTIQDLDVLQAAVQTVFIPDWLCERVGELTAAFEEELTRARRADPTFLPARYLSTRTIVRLGQILRAACVYDWAMNGQQRPLRATQADLSYLRLSLLLSGPSAEQLAAFEKVESDPREARQLAIMRTEHDLFERVLRRLKPPVPPPLTSSDPTEEVLATTTPDLVGQRDDETLQRSARELAEVSGGGHEHAVRAAAHLEAVVAELTRRALSSGLANGGSRPAETAGELLELAAKLERASADRRGVARWLRGRALETVMRCLEQAPVDLQRELKELTEGGIGPDTALTVAESRLQRFAALGSLRQALHDHGTVGQEPGELDRVWRTAIERLEDSLVALWDDALKASVAQALRGAPAGDLGAVLNLLAQALTQVEAAERRFEALGARGTRLKERVISPRLSPFVKSAFERFDVEDSAAVTKQVDALLGALQAHDLERAIASEDVLSWCAEALLRSEPASVDLPPTYAGYRKLRGPGQRVSAVFVLAEIVLKLTPDLTRNAERHGDVMGELRQRLAGIPETLRTAIGACDVERVERAVTLLERLWAKLEREIGSDPAAALERLAKSGFFAITGEESALTRFSLELSLVESLIAGTDTKALRTRIGELEQKSSRRLRELVARRSDDEWRRALAVAKRA